MSRPVRIGLIALLTASILTGITYAATRPIPENQPRTTLQNTTATELPGDANGVAQALQAPGPFKTKILVVGSTEGENKTDYLDRVASSWDEPAADTLLLVLFREDNWDIRFFMGATFRAHGVTVNEMLGFVREIYLPKARTGDPSGGLVDYLAAVTKRMGGSTVWAPKLSFTVPDPFGAGATRQTAAGQVEIGKGLVTAYLSQFQASVVPEEIRLNDWRFDINQLNVVGSSANSLLFSFTYDVLPLHPDNTTWFTGNGVQGDGGWVVHKFHFMKVVKDGDQWRLESLATG